MNHAPTTQNGACVKATYKISNEISKILTALFHDSEKMESNGQCERSRTKLDELLDDCFVFNVGNFKLCTCSCNITQPNHSKQS